MRPEAEKALDTVTVWTNEGGDLGAENGSQLTDLGPVTRVVTRNQLRKQSK
jgi:hypothetical protein